MRDGKKPPLRLRNSTETMDRNQTVEIMLTEKVSVLILKNAVPTICSMMVSAIYNTADTFFVSKLGTPASGAVGIIFSIMAVMHFHRNRDGFFNRNFAWHDRNHFSGRNHN